MLAMYRISQIMQALVSAMRVPFSSAFPMID